MSGTHRGLLLALAAAVALLSCATPDPPRVLVDAEHSYRAAANDAEVSENAPVSLYEAKKDLDRAQQMWEEDPDDPAVEHRAYIAQRRVEIARELATQRAADQRAQALSRERDRAVLEARERQVDLARVEAERARQAEQAAATRAAELQKQIEELQAKETERGLVITLGDVLFDFNRADLRPGARQNVSRLVAFLREHDDRQVLIEGHTDSVGDDAYNMNLSQRRAEAVRTYLIDSGISPTRSVARGYGESRPVASNDNEAGRQQNRRVEIVILDPGEQALDHVLH
jgi:outer membrane protein OmpA-like peptidoglycan-associated protein